MNPCENVFLIGLVIFTIVNGCIVFSYEPIEYKEECEFVNITVYEKHNYDSIETSKGLFRISSREIYDNIALYKSYIVKYDSNRVIIEIVEEVKL